jgi:hypothetical protein
MSGNNTERGTEDLNPTAIKAFTINTDISTGCIQSTYMVIFQVLTVVTMKSMIYWLVTRCSLETDVSEEYIASIAGV